jgi:hypothetical protein
MASQVDVPFLNLAEDVLLRPWVLGDLPLVQEAAADEYIPQITTIPTAFSPEADAPRDAELRSGSSRALRRERLKGQPGETPACAAHLHRCRCRLAMLRVIAAGGLW